MRRHPRFIAPQEVQLSVEGRNALRPVWMRDISKGGLFIETADPPPLRSPIRVTIQTPDGGIELRAEVVHVEPAGATEKGGIGIQFVDLCPQKRNAIENYVEGLAARLSSGVSSSVTRVSEASLAKAVQAFLRAFEQEDLYAALGADPCVGTPEIKDRLMALHQVFTHDGKTLSPALATRLSHAVSLLRRIEMLMLDHERRLDYDLRHGHIRAEARLQGARPEERVALRRRWSQLYPERMRKAEALAREALEQFQKLDYDRAIPPASEALELDPFNVELREALEAWSKVQSVRKGPRPLILRYQPA